MLRGAPTPRIDSIADQGLKLLNFNVEAQCTPSRSAILTGRHPIRSGTHSVAVEPPDGLTRWEVTSAQARVETADVHCWMRDTFPVILVLYDAQADVGYWLYVQAHFAPGGARIGTGQTVTVHIPVANVVDEAAVRRFAAAKAAIQEQTKGVRHHA